jgi:hypothetical protein
MLRWDSWGYIELPGVCAEGWGEKARCVVEIAALRIVCPGVSDCGRCGDHGAGYVESVAVDGGVGWVEAPVGSSDPELHGLA